MAEFIPKELHHYEVGDYVRKDDMNAIERRLSRLEKTRGLSPISIKN